MDDEPAPVRDVQSFANVPHIGEDDIDRHHQENWQNQAMYIGLHFPGEGQKKHRKHRKHKHRDSDKKKDGGESSHPSDQFEKKMVQNRWTMEATPPSQRIQFLLGQEATDEDHQIHDVFCEMGELRQDDEDGWEWKETARWVKFEEAVEEGGNRWSKPHVATLSLHSLFELRKGMLSGTVMLDLEGWDLVQVSELVLDNMIATGQLKEEDREDVQDILLARHRHQHQKKSSDKGMSIVRSMAEIGRRASTKNIDPKDLEMIKQMQRGNSIKGGSGADLGSRRQSAFGLDKGFGRRASSAVGFGDDMSRIPSTHKFNEHFFKKLPPGTEASNILVGEVEQLEHPVMAFIRLKKSVLLGDLTEVPIPTRFLFVLLGPVGHKDRYHEIGRSIATLMSDEVFHEIAYKARNRGDLLAGIDEFLDQVTVLPPGEWDPNIRIEPPKSVPSQAARKGGAGADGGPNGMPNGSALKEEEAEGGDEEGHCDPTLERTGRLFGGLVQDIKRKAKWFGSDFSDAVHIQCFASFFFIYFACLTPIITFGGLLGAATENHIAAMESLMSGAICGVSWHLLAGQPLTVIGSTGPVLVFETIVYNFCSSQGLAYLSFRFWIGMWMAAILLIMVAFDLSALVRYITRFTEESFALLIALIFIVEAFKKLFHIMDHYAIDLKPDEPKDYNCFCIPQNRSDPDTNFTTPIPISMTTSNANATNMTITPIDWETVSEEDCSGMGGIVMGGGCDTPHYVADVFFFSCLLFMFTYGISITLKNFRNARFFPNKVRSIISDFAVMIAIVSMVVFDFLMGLDTPKLLVPEKVQPTRDDRDWLVNPFENPVWTIPAALLPALLATILIFMDQQITAVIVNRKEHLLKKGGGYHLDLLLIAIQIAICSAFGTPWFVAATVLSINHVRSLTRESETSAPGERPKFLGVREQRVTGLLVFMLVGLSALMSTVLKYIPMPVLYGVFLFMGTSSMKGIQLVQRVLIMFMPQKYQPDYVYLRHVPLYKCHIFTSIQIGCLAALWAIKSIHSISIIFPLMVLAMCFVRKLLDYVFTRHELRWLDDILPESHKKDKEDKKKKKDGKKGGLATDSDYIEMTGGAVNIPLKDGKSVSIPVDKITYDPQSNQINISEEMGKTAIWKQLVANESNPNFQSGLRNRGNQDVRKTAPPKSNSNQPVRFTIAEDDEEEAKAPKIVVDSPTTRL